MLQPLNDGLLVREQEKVKTTPGGIALPDGHQDQHGVKRGTVVATGPGRLLENGERAEMSVGVDDEIIFSQFAGTELEDGGEKVLLVGEGAVLAKVV